MWSEQELLETDGDRGESWGGVEGRNWRDGKRVQLVIGTFIQMCTTYSKLQLT